MDMIVSPQPVPQRFCFHGGYLLFAFAGITAKLSHEIKQYVEFGTRPVPTKARDTFVNLRLSHRAEGLSDVIIIRCRCTRQQTNRRLQVCCLYGEITN